MTAAKAMTSSPTRLFWRPDALLAFIAGSVTIALVYYVLLLRETTFHRVLAADASRPAYGVAVAVLAVAACLLFGANLAAVNVLARARAGGRLTIGAGAGGVGGCLRCWLSNVRCLPPFRYRGHWRPIGFAAGWD